MKSEQLDQLFSLLLNALPNDMQLMRADLSKNLKVALSATLAKMEIVTREEFDVQAKLLARTRAKLESIQCQLDELKQ